MTGIRPPILWLALLLAAGPVHGHGVEHAAAAAPALTVTAVHADGAPLADAEWTATPPGADAPTVRGRTDVRGRLAFVPHATGTWRVAVRTPDGHGFTTEVEWTGDGATAADDPLIVPVAGVRTLAGVVIAGLAGFLAGRRVRRD